MIVLLQKMSRAPNWYLDPLVAAQKRTVHVEWIRRNVSVSRVPVMLKTDLFEEANGEDQLLFCLPFEAGLKIGMDIDPATVQRASSRSTCCASRFVVADCRGLPFPDGSMDVVLSNSTLDHFLARGDLETSIRELVRVLKPGGLLLVTLDNPQNPLYLLFRPSLGWWRLAPRLGRTASQRKLVSMMETVGLQVLTTDWLIHNPRFVSTLLFLGVRRLCGRRADRVICGLLRAFQGLDRLPTRAYSAVFVAACGRKA